MTIVNSLKLFFNKLNGQTPSGNNIAEVIMNGTTNVDLDYESSIVNRTTTLESAVGTLNQGETALSPRVRTLDSTVGTLTQGETALSPRVRILDSTVGTLNQGETALSPRVRTLEGSTVQYEDETKTSFTLKSSTDSSTKEFKITITDDGTISATEIQ